jgi:hypothetical protein
VRNGQGWAFSYAVGDEDDEKLFHLEAHPMRLDDYVTITEPDGATFPFRIVRAQPDGVAGP